MGPFRYTYSGRSSSESPDIGSSLVLVSGNNDYTAKAVLGTGWFEQINPPKHVVSFMSRVYLWAEGKEVPTVEGFG
jgi:hypothetical protein